MKSNECEERREPYYITAINIRLAWLGLKLNEHPLSDEHFDIIIEKEKIILIRENLKWDGLYLVYNEHPVIYLKATLEGTKKTFVAWHEMAHHWLHEPSLQLFHPNLTTIDKTEYQASVVAACALIPLIYVESFSENELLELFHRQVVDFRLQLYRDFHF